MAQPNETADLDRQARAHPGPSRFRGAFLVAVGLNVGLFAGVLGTRGRFMEIFTDFGYDELPAITSIVRSRVFVWLVAVLVGLTVFAEWRLKDRTVNARCNAIAILAALVLGAIYVVGMFRPLITLIGRLS